MNIVNIISPNFTQGRKNYNPEAIVIHTMSGSLTGNDTLFTNPQSSVSSHYGIGKNGEIHAYVSETNTAWHAGRVNAPLWSLLKGAGNGLYINPNYYTIGINYEGSEGIEWTPDMYDTGAALIKDICARWGIPVDSRHIVAHQEIYSLKTCPGSKADLGKLVILAGGSTGTNTILVPPAFTKVAESGKVTTTMRLNLRPRPDTTEAPVNAVVKNVQLAYDGYTNDGEKINGNGKWYYTNEGNWFWSGAVALLATPPVVIISLGTTSSELSEVQVKNATGGAAINAAAFLPYLIDTCAAYQITTPARRLCFLAQAGHESGGLFFTEELVSGKAYEGRTDLGNIHAGDGVRYKGRGLIQITGRINYQALSHAFGEDFITQPELLGGKNVKLCTPQQLKYAALSAGWFWNSRNLNSVADNIDIKKSITEGDNLHYFKEMTHKINGGSNGLSDRVTKFIAGAPFF